jgi:hypothetical protein
MTGSTRRGKPIPTTATCSRSCTGRTAEPTRSWSVAAHSRICAVIGRAGAEDATGVADYLNRVQKYVVSSTITDPKSQNSTVLGGDSMGQVAALKEQPGHDIVVTGSITSATL